MRYILTAILAFGVGVCQAKTSYVDANGTGDYPTIQAAVDDSNSGDVIILMPGTYIGNGNRNIDTKGKNITIQSTDPNDPVIVAATVMDCRNYGRGFRIVNGESPILAGFTIKNGMNRMANEFGDAIYSKNSSPTIINCIIEKCKYSGYPFPGYPYSVSETILCEQSNINLIGCDINENSIAVSCTDSNTEIRGCNIRNNDIGAYFSSHGTPWTPGILSTAKITDTIITKNIRSVLVGRTNLTIESSTISDNNYPSSSYYHNYGMSGIDAQESNVIIKDSIISRNKSIYASSSSPQPDGGGVIISGGTLDINNCIVSDNKAGYSGGGITNYQGTAFIRNCQIINNTAGGFSQYNQQYIGGIGGGVYSYNPTKLLVEKCTIKSNLTLSNPANTLNTSGGGIFSIGGYSGSVSAINCTILNNEAVFGGGICDRSFMDVNNCLLANNKAKKGGGIYSNTTGSHYINCTFVGNKAISYAGLSNSASVVVNCIFWDDLFFGDGTELDTWGVSYCDVRGGYSSDSGKANINADPMFTFENDGHLLPGSPCIDRGTNSLPNTIPATVLATTDLDGNPRVVDGDSDGKVTVDMGAFEFDSSISRLAISDSEFDFWCAKDGLNPEPQVLQIRNTNGGTIDWQIVENCPWLSVSANSGTSDGVPSNVIISVDANQLDIGTYQADMLVSSSNASGSPHAVHITVQIGRLLSVPQNYNTIQKAIDTAINGDWVIVADGVYTGAGNRDIDFRGKAITVCSQNGPQSCMIDCNGSMEAPHRAFIFQTGETNRSILDGFTITDGNIIEGGAIWINNCSPTIKNCVFSKNAALFQGGAISALEPYSSIPPMPIVIDRCTFIENFAIERGGAIYSYSPLKLTACNYINNAVTGFRGMAVGGAIGLNSSSIPCSALIEGCSFTGNTAPMGGAINAQSGSAGGNIGIINSNINGNSARDRFGALNIYPKFNTVMSNSVIAGNRARNNGGIAIAGTAQMSNCTIAGNASINSGSSTYIPGTNTKVRNCIFADYGPKVQTTSADIKFCNLQGGLPFEGNIDVDSRFVRDGYWADSNDPNIILEPNDINAVWINGDYHLRPDSPCIDAGDPNYICKTGETDLDGNPRIVNCSGYGNAIVDMGAYEAQNTAPVAEAGPNQIAYAWINGIAEVNLDGSASYDSDGDALTYLWKWSIDGNDFNTNGINPKIELPAGEYAIELVVNDGLTDSQPDYVTITVVEPIEGTLNIVPKIINGRSSEQRILAMLRLPAGISRSDLDFRQKVLLYPGGIQSTLQFILPGGEKGNQQYTILAFFNKAELMDSIVKPGNVKIAVAGHLKTGQYFYGTDSVWIMNPSVVKKPMLGLGF